MLSEEERKEILNLPHSIWSRWSSRRFGSSSCCCGRFNFI